eukprot:CAMPEP_0118875468 /NCGR_PEP_ID=MMETSP1163-20130328/16533_1 /TAXON_ID=124430 /ORGANISM="Phaeomonas parva, Strain CCMP2877" /LENGTH=123 /DNA_ID=CAMNT_0006810979 /DNA_START=109 /DNA_END=476 /DNA_ORIENTATION=+
MRSPLALRLVGLALLQTPLSGFTPVGLPARSLAPAHHNHNHDQHHTQQRRWATAAPDADLEESGHILGFGDPDHEETILQQICTQRRKDVEAARAKVSVAELEAQAAEFAAAHGGPISLFDRV